MGRKRGDRVIWISSPVVSHSGMHVWRPPRRRAFPASYSRSFRDAFREMLESVSKNGHTFEECKRVLKDSTPSRLSQLPRQLFENTIQISSSIPASRTSSDIASRRTYP